MQNIDEIFQNQITSYTRRVYGSEIEFNNELDSDNYYFKMVNVTHEIHPILFYIEKPKLSAKVCNS